MSNSNGIAAVTGNIALVFTFLNQPEKALKYYDNAIELYSQIGNKEGLARNWGNIGIVYSDMKQYDKSIKYYKKALNYYKNINDKRSLAINYSNIGRDYNKKNNPEKALEYYQKSLNINEDLNNKASIALKLSNISSTYNILGKYKIAKEYAKRSEKISKKLNLIRQLKYAYINLSNAYIGLNNYKKALEYKELWYFANDSIFNIEKSKLIEEMQTKYETEKKEKQILQQQTELDKTKLEIAKEKAEKEKRQTQLYMSIFVFILIFIAVIFIFISYKHKKEKNILLAEQKLLRSQMNPHFISNALGSIQQYILANNPIDGARYLSKFASLMRNIIESTRNENVTIETELQTLDNYLSLQQLRFKDKFDFKIEIDENIEQEETLIPAMLAQPIIENSIKHAFKNIEYKGLIEINFKLKNEEKIILTIKDNGVGLDNTNENHTQHISYATAIIKERISALNKNSKEKYTFKTQNRAEIEDNSGTIVIFELPLIFTS